MSLVPLVVRSSYSFLRGVAEPSALARAAKEAGLSRLALTDRNAYRGVPTFVDACAQEGLGPILGVEFVDLTGRLVLLARSRLGFSALCACLTEGAEIGAGHGPQGSGAKGSGDKGSATKGSGAPALARAALLRGSGGFGPADLFALSDDVALLGRGSGLEGLFALITPLNRSIWAELFSWGGKAVASPEISFLEPRQRETQRLLLAIGRKAALGEVGEGELDPLDALWTRSCLGVLESALDSGPWAVPSNLAGPMKAAFEANAHIAAEALAKPFSGFIFPGYRGDIVSGIDAILSADAIRDAVAGSVDAGSLPSAELLASLVREGAIRRYGAYTQAVAERAEYELALINAKGFCDYFLVVRDIVRRASRVCGRGSAAASIVAYCLGITEVDPLRHGLYFDRFLNPGRKDPPDIDVDFAWDERDGIIEAVVKAYGPERTARVANHNCFKSKSALRETARAFGMPDGEISSFEKALRVDKAGTLASADPEWKKIAELASSIVGLPRNLGTHSGGIIIVPDKLSDHAPIEETGTGIRVISWDKEGAETAGLVKIDLLGNRSLAVVRDAALNLNENGIGFPPDPWNPIDDADTVRLLSRGDTMGVFYVESPAMRILQEKTGRGDFEHLVIHSSIIRPAANKYINEYVDRLKGKPWKPLHPLLATLFTESYGILCYQEDVSRAAMALAGFSSTDADGIRKILSKKDVDTRLQKYWPAFSQGARAKGVDDDTIKAVWDMMRSFSGYSFVKAHSASYAMLSFQSAFLRAHYPAEFMAAVLSNHGGFYSTLAYSSEARRMGIGLLSPDVNESEWLCKGKGRLLRFGFCMVSSLSEGLAQAILAERRRGGPYASVEDFAARMDFASRQDFASIQVFGRDGAEALVGSGAFDFLCRGRRAAALMALFSYCSSREPGASSSGELFPDLDGAAFAPGAAASFGASVAPRRRKEAELKYLGTTLGSHPLELWPRAFAQPRTRAAELRNRIGMRVRILGWLITAKPVLTAQEEAMEFLSFEDETAIIEAVLFPAAYVRFRHLLFDEGPLWITGRVEEDRGAVTLTIEDLRPAM